MLSASCRPKDVEQGTHDGGRRRDEDAGDDAGFAVRIALGNGIRAGPDFHDSPDEAHHEQHPEGGPESVPQLGNLREGARGKSRA